MEVLVTGGTGDLGDRVVTRLLGRGDTVRVLSRRAAASVPPGASLVVGDVLTGNGIEAAVNGVEVVVHAASNPRRRSRRTEITGMRHISSAASHIGAHVIYTSIVGVDRHGYSYYRSKYAAEQVLERSGAPWTVLRATQFHTLLHKYFLAAPVFFRTPHLAFQVVDPDEVADAVVELVGGGPEGLAPDFGGPEVVPIRELASTRREVIGRAARLVRVPALGWLGDFERGVHLTPEHRMGRLTWREWLERQTH